MNIYAQISLPAIQYNFSFFWIGSGHTVYFMTQCLEPGM